MRLLSWHQTAWNDYQYWQKTDKQVVRKINNLIKDILRSPFSGIGKPEPLIGNYAGFWSRRITQEHRLIYYVRDGQITIASCRYHY